jgi:hypothetical protein
MNYVKIISQIKSNKIAKDKLEIENKDIGLLKNNYEEMKEIFRKIINNEISVRESQNIIKKRAIYNNLTNDF